MQDHWTSAWCVLRLTRRLGRCLVWLLCLVVLIWILNFATGPTFAHHRAAGADSTKVRRNTCVCANSSGFIRLTAIHSLMPILGFAAVCEFRDSYRQPSVSQIIRSWARAEPLAIECETLFLAPVLCYSRQKKTKQEKEKAKGKKRSFSHYFRVCTKNELSLTYDLFIRVFLNL